MKVARVLLILGLGLASSSCLGLPPALDITRLESLEPACLADLKALRQGLDTGQLWAQTMVDAGVKSPVGLLSQTAVQFGDFDECLTISSPVTGQFCLVDVSPAEGNITSWTPFKWGMCVPASCSALHLGSSLQTYMDGAAAPGEAVSVRVIPEACTTRQTSSRSVTTADVVFIVLVASVVLLVCVATVYDVITRPDYDGFSPPVTVSQCLSARLGLHSLLRGEQQIPGVNLRALYGLHACAFFFVVMGHRFGVHIFFMTITNYRDAEHMFLDSGISVIVGHMDLFVDIFFFMSAFLLSSLYYAELHKRFISPFMVYLQRISRIIPAYAVVVFFYATLLRQLGDGPLWNMFMDVEQSKCRGYWWANLLFINTYVETGNMCLLQSWYIACDFQLFVGGTLLVFLLQRYARLGIVATVIVFLASTLAPFLGTYLYNRPATLLFYKDFWTDARHHDMFTSVYSQGHYRGTSYLMGLLAGCYVYERRQHPLSKWQTNVLQVVGVVTCVLVFWSGSMFYDLSAPQGRLFSALYAALYHSVFGMGLALLLISCALGQSTMVSRLFSWEGFVPLSKLSYCVYLVHNIPQFVWVASSRTPVYFNALELLSWSIADVVLSLVLALALSLAVENPIRYLVKFIVTGSSPSTTVHKVADPKEIHIIKDALNFEKR